MSLFTTQLSSDQLLEAEVFAPIWGAYDDYPDQFMETFCERIPEFGAHPDVAEYRHLHGGDFPVVLRFAAGLVMRDLGFDVALNSQAEAIPTGIFSMGRTIDG